MWNLTYCTPGISPRSNSDIVWSVQYPYLPELTEFCWVLGLLGRLPLSSRLYAVSHGWSFFDWTESAYVLWTVPRAEIDRVGDWWGMQKECLNSELQCAFMKLEYLRPPAELCAMFLLCCLKCWFICYWCSIMRCSLFIASAEVVYHVFCYTQRDSLFIMLPHWI
jgi:hypothetical protein